MKLRELPREIKRAIESYFRMGHPDYHKRNFESVGLLYFPPYAVRASVDVCVPGSGGAKLVYMNAEVTLN